MSALILTQILIKLYHDHYILYVLYILYIILTLYIICYTCIIHYIKYNFYIAYSIYYILFTKYWYCFNLLCIFIYSITILFFLPFLQPQYLWWFSSSLHKQCSEFVWYVARWVLEECQAISSALFNNFFIQ